MNLSPPRGGGSVAVDSLLIDNPILVFCSLSLLCCAFLCVTSSFAIILIGKREMVASLCLFSWCLVIVVWLFHTRPQVCLQFVIVVFLDYTHYVENVRRRRVLVKSE